MFEASAGSLFLGVTILSSTETLDSFSVDSDSSSNEIKENMTTNEKKVRINMIRSNDYNKNFAGVV